MSTSADPLMLPKLKKVKQAAERSRLQQACRRLCRVDAEAPFPGSQPVSFERKHLTREEPLSLLQKTRAGEPMYYAAEKTDGMRYMMLILSSGVYMVDRNFEFIALPKMHFPVAGAADDEQQLDETLLDGELVLDDVLGPSGATEKLRYLAYDACCVRGKPLMELELRHRLLWCRREVLGPRYRAADEGHAFEGEPFTVEMKDFFSLPQLPHIFQHVEKGEGHDAKYLYAFDDPLRRVKHGNDGVIFTPTQEGYIPGTCKSLLKWKPADMNSIDFQLRAVWRKESSTGTFEPRFQIYIAHRGSLLSEAYSWITFTEEQQKRFANDAQSDRRIVECVYDPNWEVIEYDDDGDTWDYPRAKMGGWRFERIRADKTLPNDQRTVFSVEQSAVDGVKQEELLETLGLRPRRQ